MYSTKETDFAASNHYQYFQFGSHTMVKIYQRYANKSSFGLINTLPCNVIFDGTGKLVISAALEQILIWSIRRGVVQAVLKEDNPDRKKQAIVTQLCLSPNKKQLAAG
jgi:U3 small nucleolar RNA-associated protein 12